MQADCPSQGKLRALYNSLDESSLSQHLAFYRLYGDFPEGQKALHHAWFLLTKSYQMDARFKNLPNLDSSIEAIIALVGRQPHDPLPALTDSQLSMIESLGSHLGNRKLRGFHLSHENDVLLLPPDEIDLARGLLLSQWGHEDIKKIRSYEAALDLMALQIQARLPSNISPEASSEQLIHLMNQYIFEEMKFKFPPHSLYAKDIDLYTFLPSVLDSRRGVCLGVSILYLCLAQRLGVSLETITPPGHIYVRYHEGDKIINIETTARGIHLDSEEYLGINTRSLQMRNIKEVIGMAHFNEASLFLQQDDFQKALQSYQKASLYMSGDKLLNELMGYTYLVLGQKEQGKALLQSVADHLPEYAVSKSTIAEDYLKGAVDSKGIKALFIPVDETRKSILKKKEALEKVLLQYPKFREGLQSLAVSWIQLHRAGEALEVLNKCHELDDQNVEIEYYLTVLNAERLNYPQAWAHFGQTERLLEERQHAPKAIKKLQKALAAQSRE